MSKLRKVQYRMVVIPLVSKGLGESCAFFPTHYHKRKSHHKSLVPEKKIHQHSEGQKFESSSSKLYITERTEPSSWLEHSLQDSDLGMG